MILFGEKLTLNDIEHEILRKDFAEPRIHFAIVCASIGCPPLSSTPFLPDSLESQLGNVARNFARSADYNQLDPDNNLASLSSIFDWFGEDFISKYYDDSVFKNLSKKENAALNFIISNYPDTTWDKLKQTAFKVKYLDYDWSLNDLR